MARDKVDKTKKREKQTEKSDIDLSLHPEVKKSIWVVVFLGLAVLFLLAGFHTAGPWGENIFLFFKKVFGWGYYLMPIMFFLLAFSLIAPERKKIIGLPMIGGLFFVLSGLGLFDIVSSGSGGLTGNLIGSIEGPFGSVASVVITFSVLAVSFLIMVNRPLDWQKFFSFVTGLLPKQGTKEKSPVAVAVAPDAPLATAKGEIKEEKKEKIEEKKKSEPVKAADTFADADVKPATQKQIKNYIAPPLSLLASAVDRPTIGDIQASANIIHRTLESFGIPVEMGEVNIGPTVTRFTLKPAEGVKLSRITGLHQDLALALAAHPIRIEAPIPGKSLVGIEVPNKSAATVRLGSLLLYPDFQKKGNLVFGLGRNVSGEPVFLDIERMPHLLIAGATGSGKSITVQSLIISLLYKNSPEMLRLIMVDPKRVELSMYDGIPHLLAPVITENKKSLGALRWALQEMDRRYQMLQEAGSRDIKSFNKGKANGETLPFILIVIDEMADLMTTYGREVEGYIIRLAQMARAVGIHLILSTQRPSVEVITGLIKANITSRVALQVASQIDSRTILDTSGAEKLLGRGDLLYTTAETSKPPRVQGAFITEDEIKSVIKFIKDNNDSLYDDLSFDQQGTTEAGEDKEERGSNGKVFLNFDDYSGGDGDDDDLYVEAVDVVRAAKKASASLLQRRLKVGYARAARLIDLMEERGVVGPGDGAKPREVFLE